MRKNKRHSNHFPWFKGQQRRPRPNFFLSIPIDEPSIITKIEEVQKYFLLRLRESLVSNVVKVTSNPIIEEDKSKIVSQTTESFVETPSTKVKESSHLSQICATDEKILERVNRCIIKTRKLHLTLLVFRISTKEVFDKVLCTLRHSQETIINDLFGEKGKEISEAVDIDIETLPFDLHLKTVGYFGRNVFWIGLEKDDCYQKLITLVEKLKMMFSEQIPELELETRPFFPHITVMKTDKSSSLLEPLLKPGVFSCLIESSFGLQRPKAVEFLYMGKEDTNGGYLCLAKCHFPSAESLVSNKISQDKNDTQSNEKTPFEVVGDWSMLGIERVEN